MPKLSDTDFIFDSGSYFDSRPFRTYADQIRGLIFAAPAPLSIRDIHRLLGPEARPRWTADAIESIRDIEALGLLPTRYRPLSRPIRGLRVPSSERFMPKPPGDKRPDLGLTTRTKRS